MAQLQVELVSVEQKVWAGEADMVIARTTEGELGLLPGHAPLLGQLADESTVQVRGTGEGELAWTVGGGFVSVTEKGVSILVETAERAGSGPAR